MRVAVVKYNAGNVQSVLFALRRLGIEPAWTDDPQELRRADKVIFPGVGEASSAMTYLAERGLDELLRSLTQPVLGICLGMQLLCAASEEQETACLGIFAQEVRRFPAGGKIPHIGWNSLRDRRGPLFEGLHGEAFMYFVHSYAAAPSEHSAAISDYIIPFSAALQRGNFYGVQFHPEKSGRDGARLLENFLKL